MVTDTDQEPKELFAEVVAAAKISDGSEPGPGLELDPGPSNFFRARAWLFEKGLENLSVYEVKKSRSVKDQAQTFLKSLGSGLARAQLSRLKIGPGLIHH